jgi:uncharacterized protein
MDLIVAFITGLTTGGLSCLAVQGGLLASSLAYQYEQDMAAQSSREAKGQKFRPRIAQPIFLFLLAKVIAYTLLGALLGALGSVLQLTPVMRAVLMIGIGIFMVGNGLRMLKVHPIFRYFIFEPPAFITRYIRRVSKKGDTIITPLFLGAMTIFIPCGITQAMMALALATGSPLQGAALMFAFTLGTTPVFFSVAYFATRLGATLEKNFTRIIAAVVIVFGLVSINYGLNLAGSPVSANTLVNNLLPAAAAPVATVDPGTASSTAATRNANEVVVLDDGYSPQVLHLAANQPIKLTWITVNTNSCSRSVVVPSLNYQQVLPVTGKVAMDIPSQAAGTVMRYSCSMGMYTGQFVFDR